MAPADAPRTPAEEQAHDVLAAEAFAVPAADPALRHDPVVLPEDPSGIAEPHDVLAAEEFAMPAPAGPHGDPASSARRRRSVIAAAGALLGLLALRRRKRQ